MSNWISVKDQMPEELDSVIVCRKQKYVANMYWDGMHWKCDGYGIISTKSYNDITHWMPLPVPPSE